MKYPFPLMSVTELVNQMHFSTDYIRRMTHHKYAYKYLQRTGTGKNSKYVFDTEEFEKLRKRGILR